MLPHEPASFDDMKDKISAEAKMNWSDNCYTVLCSYLDTLLDNDLTADGHNRADLTDRKLFSAIKRDRGI